MFVKPRHLVNILFFISYSIMELIYRKNWVTAPVLCPFFWQYTMVQWTIRPKNLAINMGVL